MAVRTFVEQEWERYAYESQESGDAGSPVDTKAIVHLGREQWEGSTEQTSEDRVGGQNGCCEDGVGIDEVVHDAEENEHHSESEGCSGHDGDDPVDGRVIGPSEPEQADGNSDRTDHAQRKTSLWWSEPIKFVADGSVPLVVPDAVGYCNQHAHGHTQKGQTSYTRGPASSLLVDNGESTETHV